MEFLRTLDGPNMDIMLVVHSRIAVNMCILIPVRRYIPLHFQYNIIVNFRIPVNHPTNKHLGVLEVVWHSYMSYTT